MPPIATPRVSKELRIVVTTRSRQAGRLDDDWPADAPEPGVDALAAHAGSAAADETVWLWGGEPCLRRDLPGMIAACVGASHGRVGLRTDGLALASPSALAPLRDAGLGGLRITLHSSRPEAHDWLVNLEGAGRRALRALRRCLDAGVPVEVEATVTRPTAPHLPELLALCRQLGVERLHLRQLTRRGPAASDFIALSPRLALTEPLLDELGGMLDERVALVLEGFPRCATGAAAAQRRPPGTLRWTLEPPGIELVENCPACPGAPDCEGVPADYVECFGRDELRSEDGQAPSPEPISAASRADTSPPPPPPPRLGRAPATRHRVVTAQVDLSIGGDPLAPRAPRQHPTQIRVQIPVDARSRSVRQQLVRAAQEGAPVLRVDAPGALRDRAGAALLHECTRLGFERVELHTDLRDLAALGDADVYALRGFDLAMTHLERPEDYGGAKPGLERMARLARTETGVLARICDAQAAEAFAEAWAVGALPGAPRFELAPGGGSLAALVALLERLPGASAAALEAQLPVCLRAAPADPNPPCDNLNPCICAEPRADCPGVPAGWSLPE